MQIFHLIILSFLILSCGKTQSQQKSSDVVQNVSPYFSSQSISIKVFYEKGAEPYTGGFATLKYWDLLEKNLQALFEGRASTPEIVVPKEISEMSALVNNNKEQWSVEEVLELSQKNQGEAEPLGVKHFNIYFLNGFSKEGSHIIGYHISGTKVMVIFKDVIKKSSESQSEHVAKYIEQSTLVHEMGHALGLVNNGLPMIHEHQDVAHGAHCSNKDCVMYYANEGVASMTSFAKKSANQLSVIMFDQQCLKDARSY